MGNVACNIASTFEQWQRDGALLEAARAGAVPAAAAALAAGANCECTDRGPKALFGLVWAGTARGLAGGGACAEGGLARSAHPRRPTPQAGRLWCTPLRRATRRC